MNGEGHSRRKRFVPEQRQQLVPEQRQQCPEVAGLVYSVPGWAASLRLSDVELGLADSQVIVSGFMVVR